MDRESRGLASCTFRRVSRAVPILAACLFVLAGGQPAWAHVDPAGSSGPGIPMTITVYRADQKSPALNGLDAGNVGECETIVYEVTLRKPSSNGAVEGGTWTLTTPDGVSHDLGSVPCIGGTTNDPHAPGGRGQCSGSPDHVTALVPYTVRGDLDPDGEDALFAVATLSGFYAHISNRDGGGNFIGLGLALTKKRCVNNLFCNPNHCDPNAVSAAFGSGHRIGTCVEDTPPDCTVSDPCAAGTCDEDKDACVTTANTGPPEVHDVAFAGDKITITWAASPDATSYDIVRGLVSALPVGPGGNDEVCFGSVPSASTVDNALPAPGTGFWYLLRGQNTCSNGIYGLQSNGLPQTTTTCGEP